MQKIALFIATIGILSGCSWFHTHKMDIEQGNIIKEEQVMKIHPGMTETEVKEIMGNPVLINLFSPNRMEYVYAFQPGYGRMQVIRLSCIFMGNILRRCEETR